MKQFRVNSFICYITCKEQIIIKLLGARQLKMERGVTSHSLPKYNLHGPLPKKFPEDIQCILQGVDRESGSIYVSNIEAAQNANTLKRLNIKSVLSCAKGYELSHDKSVVRNYLYIPALDHQKFDISIYLDKGVDFISSNLATSNVLVHCIAGVSRSVTMVIAYFIKQHQMDFQQAYYRVKSKRHIINPNPGFVSSLKQYQKDLERKRSFMTRSYASPPKDDSRTSTTDFPSKQELPTSTTFYEQKYNNPASVCSSRYNQMTPEPKHSQSVSKNSSTTTKLYEKKITENLIQKEPSYTRTKTNFDSGYFQSLNAELQEKIQKIRSKYDVQREQLQERYHPRRPASDYPDDHINNISKYNYAVTDYRNSKMKTQSTDQKAKVYGQSPRQYKYIDIDGLFPKTFYNEPVPNQEASPKKDYNLYPMNQNIYLTRQAPLSKSKYGVNDSFKYNKYQTLNNFNKLNTYGLRKKLYP